MLTKVHIENFKSIHDETIELGRVNVFIGENGSGKSNILEALALASAAKSNRLRNDDFAQKGIRVTRPDMMISSFVGNRQKNEIIIDCIFDENLQLHTNLKADDLNDITTNWVDSSMLPPPERLEKFDTKVTADLIQKLQTNWVAEILRNASREKKIKLLNNPKYINDLVKEDYNDELTKLILKQWDILNLEFLRKNSHFIKLFDNYIIYEVQTNPLRGINKKSYEIPGRNGENLDLLIERLDEKELEQLVAHSKFISWLDDEGILIDREGELDKKRLKLLSDSRLYFRDKFMQKKNNVFSVENANEGALHILFYLALFISKRTQNLLAIDNIENALNPHLCRLLIENIVELAKANDKQTLITTHNPAILDGLNLHDDEQRLFVVSRNSKGHTKIERIEFKPDAKVGGTRLKLSELWMRNIIGGLPQNF